MAADKNILTVSVKVTVEIDLEAWRLSYGDHESIPEIRDYVKESADRVVKEHFRRTGVLAEAVS